MTFPELYDDSHPEAIARNNSENFPLGEKTSDAVKKFRRSLPAIGKAMPPLLVAANAQPQFQRIFRELVGATANAGEKILMISLHQRSFCSIR